MKLYNNDCFNVFPEIEDNSIDLFILDLPYANKKFGNCTACRWDTPIDLKEMWKEIKRIMKPNATIVHFCNTKFGFALIESNPKWFRYDLIWKKSKKLGFLSANKMPLRQHENIYVFSDNNITYSKNGKYGTYNPQKTEGKPFKVKGGKSKNVNGSLSRGHEVLTEEYENKGDRHPTSIIEMEPDHENIYVFKDKQGKYNPQKTEREKDYKHSGKRSSNPHYGGLLECNKEYKKEDGKHPSSIIEMEPDHENIYVFKDKQGTYNPQLKEGKYRNDKPLIENGSVYGFESYERKGTKNPNHRFPSSILDIENTILEYKNPSKTIHRTQKPVDLIEWLIKTYSNENDTVMDFCMGSGTTGVACLNTNRKFIGVEKEQEMFEKAKKRIEDVKN